MLTRISACLLLALNSGLSLFGADFDMKVTVSRTEVGGYCAECLEKSSS